MNNMINIDYHGEQLRAVEVNGEPWFTADVVGKGLGYAQEQARKSVGNLYQRFSDEFRGNDTCVINLMTQGQRRVTRVFSLSGIVLLGFFANTEPAKKFRQWAKLELEARMKGKQEVSFVSVGALEYIDLLKAKIKLLEAEGQARWSAAKPRKAKVKPTEDLITEAFFAAIRPHLPKLDHSCKPEFLALHLPEIYQRAEFWELELPYIRDLYVHLKRRSDYVANKPMHSRRDGGKRQCWIFRRPPQLRLVQCGGTN